MESLFGVDVSTHLWAIHATPVHKLLISYSLTVPVVDIRVVIINWIFYTHDGNPGQVKYRVVGLRDRVAIIQTLIFPPPTLM